MQTNFMDLKINNLKEIDNNYECSDLGEPFKPLRKFSDTISVSDTLSQTSESSIFFGSNQNNQKVSKMGTKKDLYLENKEENYFSFVEKYYKKIQPEKFEDYKKTKNYLPNNECLIRNKKNPNQKIISLNNHCHYFYPAFFFVPIYPSYFNQQMKSYLQKEEPKKEDIKIEEKKIEDKKVINGIEIISPTKKKKKKYYGKNNWNKQNLGKNKNYKNYKYQKHNNHNYYDSRVNSFNNYNYYDKKIGSTYNYYPY